MPQRLLRQRAACGNAAASTSDVPPAGRGSGEEGEVGRGAVTFDEREAGAVAALAAGVMFPGRRGSGEAGRSHACPCCDEIRRTPELQVVQHVAFLLSSASDSG